MMRMFVVIVAVLLFSVDALAGLEVFSGGVEIRLAGSGVGCTAFTEGGVQKTWTKIEANQANEKQLIATVLMAFSTGRAVDIHCGNPADWTALDRIIVSP